MECGLQSAQEVVQPFGDRLDFPGCLRHDDSFSKVRLADPADLSRHFIQGVQAPADDPPHDAEADGDCGAPARCEQRLQPPQREVDRGGIARQHKRNRRRLRVARPVRLVLFRLILIVEPRSEDNADSTTVSAFGKPDPPVGR